MNLYLPTQGRGRGEALPILFTDRTDCVCLFFPSTHRSTLSSSTSNPYCTSHRRSSSFELVLNRFALGFVPLIRLNGSRLRTRREYRLQTCPQSSRFSSARKSGSSQSREDTKFIATHITHMRVFVFLNGTNVQGHLTQSRVRAHHPITRPPDISRFRLPYLRRIP